MKVRFNKPPLTGKELPYINEAISNTKLSGDGPFTAKCQKWFRDELSCKQALMTPSCTHALEMAALLIDIKPGDEVIMPSYTFVSTANAFLLRGAKIKFVDVQEHTMNIDPECISQAITANTKAIIVVHYAGVICDMDEIASIARSNNLYLIEDAAQAIGSYYKGRPAGSFGDMAAFSFHETKNITSGGEGGMLVINNSSFVERAEIIREKGTNRSKFFRGEIDKYSWVDLGSSFLPSELQSAYLMAQLENCDHINQDRLNTWEYYYRKLMHFRDIGKIEIMEVPNYCKHNAHLFYIILDSELSRNKLLSLLKSDGIGAVFHYVPLHSTRFGISNTEFIGDDKYTTSRSSRLLRLPLWYGMKEDESEMVASALIDALGKL